MKKLKILLRSNYQQTIGFTVNVRDGVVTEIVQDEGNHRVWNTTPQTAGEEQFLSYATSYHLSIHSMIPCLVTQILDHYFYMRQDKVIKSVMYEIYN